MDNQSASEIETTILTLNSESNISVKAKDGQIYEIKVNSVSTNNGILVVGECNDKNVKLKCQELPKEEDVGIREPYLEDSGVPHLIVEGENKGLILGIKKN